MDRLTRITPAGEAGAMTTAEIMELLPEGRYRVRAGGRETIARGSEGVVYTPGDRALLAGTDHGPVLLNPLGSRSAAPLEVRIHD
ncbi:hypothetical protein DPQ33_03660 [Oceanidesulfovibrio indonesiensis]|uniref:Uncharacterized protein n=1 Tax=Oceanidesulfovibrio indonesiensis TaxID=54767 RepID=A0A7M3MIF2_9BACT|nr:hypothetical protein [Oceanidesulfovibrio indonesiensis]TVM19466.1 hypothetical protein DPQ33_03660 [Oceanidesulfovibrio indonesiensis]